MFTWTTQAPLHLLPSIQEDLNTISESFIPALWLGLHLGTSYFPFNASLTTCGDPRQCAGTCAYQAASRNQLLISRNFVSQLTSHRHGRSIYIHGISRCFKTARHCPLLHSGNLLLHAAHWGLFFLFSPTLPFPRYVSFLFCSPLAVIEQDLIKILPLTMLIVKLLHLSWHLHFNFG